MNETFAMPVVADAVAFQSLVGTLHSIGPDGPTYEVLRIIDHKRALICILESEREVEYDIEDILADPGPDAARARG
jgi:hypothetical protein